MMLAAVAGIVWANSPWSDSYLRFWETEIGLTVGGFHLSESLHGWVNDGLMTVFFFVVSLEIKRAFTIGELSNRRSAALPIAAALGGMVLPALIYAGLNLGGAGLRGWGIPMATDIAFAIAVLALLGSRIPTELRLFLLALAIVDDIGAILVIAVFYSGGIHLGALGAAVLVFVTVLAMRRLGVRSEAFYLVLGLIFWVAVLESGVHATIAGVIMGLLTPVHPYVGRATLIERLRAVLGRLAGERQTAGGHARPSVPEEVEALGRDSESPLDRLEHRVAPWSNYLVLPVFALSNAGVALSSDALGGAVTSPVLRGVAAGLLLGKPVGVFSFAWAATRLGLAKLPEAATWRHMMGIGVLSGIGFTVSLFITTLAFSDEALASAAKVGILAASTVAAVAGYLVLRIAGRRGAAPPPAGPGAASPR